jgi:hypothetical protein
MRTVHCPLCGLRYTHTSELDLHVREDHCPEAEPEGHEAIVKHKAAAAQEGDPRRVLRLPW